MKFMLRWISDALAIYLALYLVDSVAHGRFHVKAIWIVVLLAVFLGLLNSLIRPLHRLKTRPYPAISRAVLTVIFNALVLQALIWAGAPVSATNPLWTLVTAAFLTLLAGTINWLIGFNQKGKPGVATTEARKARALRKPGEETPRT